MLILEIVAGVIVAVLLAAAALRFRKLHRDEMRRLSRPVERRLMTPPASPYEPSKGFRLLDEGGQPLLRPPVERPRIDPTRQYVFSESSSGGDEAAVFHARHNDDWFLSRSGHHSPWSIVRRFAVVILIALVVAVIVSYALHGTTSPSGPTTTTTLTPHR